MPQGLHLATRVAQDSLLTIYRHALRRTPSSFFGYVDNAYTLTNDNDSDTIRHNILGAHQYFNADFTTGLPGTTSDPIGTMIDLTTKHISIRPKWVAKAETFISEHVTKPTPTGTLQVTAREKASLVGSILWAAKASRRPLVTVASRCIDWMREEGVQQPEQTVTMPSAAAAELKRAL